MADLYLDHNISLHVVPLLQAAGQSVTSARDLGLARLPDDAQLLSATQAGRVLISHDRYDFTMLHDAWQSWPAAFGLALPPHPGILIMNPAPPLGLVGEILDFLEATAPAVLVNELFWWHGSGWRRRLVGIGWEQYSGAGSTTLR